MIAKNDTPIQIIARISTVSESPGAQPRHFSPAQPAFAVDR
jgi:hypothetical protein